MTSSTSTSDTPGSNEPPESLPRRVAGRYLLKRLLGRGGFGAVYEAYDELDDRSVALKLIRRDVTNEQRGTRSQTSGSGSGTGTGGTLLGGGTRRTTRSFGNTPGSGRSDDFAEAFREEFRLLTQLHHPNLAAVYDFGRCSDSDALYFTQELVIGQDLSRHCKQASRETIVEIFIQLARALDYIHALGLVHGDIKPSNVLVRAPEKEGALPQAKLIDFGLARMFRRNAEASDEELDKDSPDVVVLGTPGFSPPEKAKGGPTDARGDIYSLAATLHAAVRGQRPFPGKNFREALRAQMDWRPELAGSLLNQCGPVVAELIGRMLSPDPDGRPQSARSLVLELLRREAGLAHDREQNDQDRRDFARVLVEHLSFVDRAHHLELLLDRAATILRPDLAASDSGSRMSTRANLIRAIVVHAPEGMGKQRLMHELRREIQLGDGLFIEGNCWASDQHPLGPFASIVSQLATAIGEGSPAVQGFPGLIAMARGKPAEQRFAVQVSEFLIACARERPFVLHVSNLSHGSERVRIAFDALLRAIDHNEAPILLCATSEPHSRLALMFQAWNRDQLAEIWQLRPFNEREMGSVLQSMLGDTPVLDELVAMLSRLTGGHPLSFRETLRVLIEEGILAREAGSWSLRSSSTAAEQLHTTLAQRCETRLDGLGVSAWEIASVLYLLEAPIEEQQLAELSDLRSDRFHRTLERLVGEGLIVRSPTSGASVVQLAHESVREAVRGRYADSLDETRIDLAMRIAELGTNDPNFVFLRARLLDDASDGLEAEEALWQAVDSLFAAAQPQLAAQVLERLVVRLRRHGGVEGLPRLLRALLRMVEDAPGALDEAAREMEHYEAGVLVAELLQVDRAEALFWLGLADRYTAVDHADLQVALDRLERAADAAKRASERVLELRIANRRAETLLGAGDVTKATRWSLQAMQIIDVPEASDADKCHVIGVRLRCLSLSGQLGEARRLHDLARPIASRVPVLRRQSYLSGIAYLAVWGGDPGRAIPEVEQAIEDLRAANLNRLLITPLHNLADMYLRNDELEKAETTFREALRLAGLYAFDYHVHLNRAFLGYVLARRGDGEEGAALLAEARTGIQQMTGEHLALQQVRLLDAEVAHLLGHSARARRELEEMLADFHTSNELSLAHWAQEALARIERDVGTAFIEAPDSVVASGDPDQDTVRTKPVN